MSTGRRVRRPKKRKKSDHALREAIAERRALAADVGAAEVVAATTNSAKRVKEMGHAEIDAKEAVDEAEGKVATRDVAREVKKVANHDKTSSDNDDPTTDRTRTLGTTSTTMDPGRSMRKYR